MSTQRDIVLLRLALLLAALPLVIAVPHGEEHGDSSMGGHMDGMNAATEIEYTESFSVPNYFRYEGHTGWIYGHIISMTLSWVIVLPLSVMFSIARSRYTLLLQFSFFTLNGIGIFLGTVYNANTPDLYENNAHHKMGWIFTWIALAWILFGILNLYSSGSKDSRTAMSASNMARYERLQQTSPDQEERRWSGDSGQGTERNSASLLCIGSPATDSEQNNFDDEPLSYRNVEDDVDSATEKRGILRNTRIDRYLTRNIHRIAIGKTLLISRIFYVCMERTMIIMGFLAFTTGCVTFGGVFRGGQVFSGLAHFIKGGIFFWYGILSIGRWAGSFADLGWAWNVKPPASVVGRRKAVAPSAEFVESMLICIYGVSNVWLEHLAAWGKAWSPMDYEHVAITILFFGGGLLGIFVESKRIRDLLNKGLLLLNPVDSQFHTEETHEPTPENPTWKPPVTATTPLNPMPSLTILLLGIIMSAHSQHSAIATTIHSYWGTLFTFASAARLTTYALNYLRPPVSYLPSRPPSELLCGFCLASGGLLFMLSPRDIIDAMAGNGWDGMVIFTVAMGITALICAGVVANVAAKGWALGRENRRRNAKVIEQA